MSTATITTRTRNLLQDLGEPFVATIPVDGVSTIYDLPYESISDQAYPLTVILNNVVISGQATPSYEVQYKSGQILFYSPPKPAGAILLVQGWYYDYFLDSEIAQCVTDGFNLHVQDQEPLPVIDPLPGQIGIDENEEYLVSYLAAIEALWMRAGDASQNIDVHTPEGVTIPVSERHEQILKQIQALNQQYLDYSNALGVGVYRIQILNQRRVSYTTNRLIPIFREQNYNAPYNGFFPTAAPVGAEITIKGKYFTNTTSVTFGPTQVPSVFTVVDDETLKAFVPEGATTGQIVITTPGGVFMSTAQFVVGQPAPFIDYGPQMVWIPIPPGH